MWSCAGSKTAQHVALLSHVHTHNVCRLGVFCNRSAASVVSRVVPGWPLLPLLKSMIRSRGVLWNKPSGSVPSQSLSSANLVRGACKAPRMSLSRTAGLHCPLQRDSPVLELGCGV